MFKRIVTVCALLAMVACGDKDSPTGPSGQPPPTPQTNRSPAINSVQVSPTFGIADLTVFNLSSTASDPDGDALSYSWSLGGQTFAGANQQVIYYGGAGGPARATVTVTDGKGGSTSGNVDFVVGSMRGNWLVTGGPTEIVGMALTLSQSSAGIVTGTFNMPLFGNGNTDPAEPGVINAQGQLRMRVKIGSFTDFTMSGTMDTTGVRITGDVRGSGFTGQPFVMVKQ